MRGQMRDAVARRLRLDPYKRVTFRRVTLDRRTRAAFLWAEKRYRAVAPRKRGPLRIGQGSWSAGSLSGTTHAGGGALDVMFAGLNAKQRRATVKWLRKAGFAAWAREGPAWGANGSNDHGHGILRGHRTASAAAKAQVESYDTGRNGLADNAADWTWKPRRSRRFSYRQNKPIIGK